MRFEVGQGVKGRARFRDGEMPLYDRVYLVVEVGENYIGVLNLSSIRGKERKLAFDSNVKLERYNPPFYRPSFVKLDSLTYITVDDHFELTLLCDGKKLNTEELESILQMYPDFNNSEIV